MKSCKSFLTKDPRRHPEYFLIDQFESITPIRGTMCEWRCQVHSIKMLKSKSYGIRCVAKQQKRPSSDIMITEQMSTINCSTTIFNFLIHFNISWFSAVVPQCTDMHQHQLVSNGIIFLRRTSSPFLKQGR